MFKSHNYLHTYDSTIAELTSSPDSPELRHRAVLALARAGALDFAWAEYERYGLGEITDHPDRKLLEDIMSLKGRLLKDMALQASDDERIQFARRSVRAYERAFAATGGYYAGINVAAMSLLGGRTERTVAGKAQAVLDLLPNEKAKSREDTYYIEATRAEALLLMGHKNKAGDILHDAVAHDPLNYTAHATTFKQFGMIMDVRGESTEWLEPFIPPTAIHFAGHIFSSDKHAINYLDQTTQEKLREDVSEQIQRHDIGFGYGALAAGADILIAETLLAEGAELHIVLPAPVDSFVASSVTPFGITWKTRFGACLEQADSLSISADTSDPWPDKNAAAFASQTAMGQAIMRAGTLFSRSAQFLVWDGREKNSATAMDALAWRNGTGTDGRRQIVIPYPGRRETVRHLPDEHSRTLMALAHVKMPTDEPGVVNQVMNTIRNGTEFAAPTMLVATETGVLFGYPQTGQAASCALTILSQLTAQYPEQDIFMAACYGMVSYPQNLQEKVVHKTIAASSAVLPGEVYIDEPFAAALSAFNATEFTAEYAGIRNPGSSDTGMRLFHLSKTNISGSSS